MPVASDKEVVDIQQEHTHKPLRILRVDAVPRAADIAPNGKAHLGP